MVRLEHFVASSCSYAINNNWTTPNNKRMSLGRTQPPIQCAGHTPAFTAEVKNVHRFAFMSYTNVCDAMLHFRHWPSRGTWQCLISDYNITWTLSILWVTPDTNSTSWLYLDHHTKQLRKAHSYWVNWTSKQGTTQPIRTGFYTAFILPATKADLASDKHTTVGILTDNEYIIHFYRLCNTIQVPHRFLSAYNNN